MGLRLSDTHFRMDAGRSQGPSPGFQTRLPPSWEGGSHGPSHRQPRVSTDDDVIITWNHQRQAVGVHDVTQDFNETPGHLVAIATICSLSTGAPGHVGCIILP